MLVSTILQEIIDESVVDLTTAQMLGYFKSAMRQISPMIKDRVFLTEGTLSVSTGAQTASLSSLSAGFIRERAVWYVKDGQRIPIDPAPSAQYFHSAYTTQGSGKPNFYLIQGGTIRFDKPVDEALTVGLDFFKEISSIALSDTFLGDERLIQAAKHLCKAEYYGDYEEDETKAARNAGKGQMILQMLQADYEEKEMGGGVEIKEVDGA